MLDSINRLDRRESRVYRHADRSFGKEGGALITRSSLVLSFAAALVLLPTIAARAQGATSSITGSVVDSAGGAIPGATVVVKNQSGVSFEATSNGEGLFNVPGVAPGVYTVTVSLTGFKTVVVNDVRVVP